MDHSALVGLEDAHVTHRVDTAFRVRDKQRQQTRRQRMYPDFPGSESGAGLIRTQHRRDRELGPDHVHERFQPIGCFELHATQPTSRDRCTENVREKLRAAHHRQMLPVHQIHGQRPHLRSPTHRCARRRREHARRLVPTATPSTFHDMVRHAHTRRDQIDNLTDLHRDDNRYGHVRATPTATLRRMHHDLVRITPTKMRTRCAGLLPRSTTRDTCLSATLGPVPSRTNTIERRRLRTVRRILPSRLLQHRDPRLQQLDQHPLLTNQPLILCAQNIDPPVIVSAQIIRHTPIEPDCTRTTVDPPE